MQGDITTRADIYVVMTAFYKKLLLDEEMSLFFKDIVAGNELEHHLSIITDFWEDLLFDTHNYKNNPMQKHLDFNRHHKAFKLSHFKLWLHYFTESIDSNFEGTHAKQLKIKAQSIATVMQVKMNLYNS